MSAKEESSPLGRCSNPIEEDASSSIPMVDADADADADPALVIESEEDEGGDKRSSSDSSSLIPSLFSDLGMTSGFSSGAASCSSFFGCGGGGGLQDLQGLPGVVPGVVPGALGDRMRKQLRINQEEESAETEEEEEKGGIIAQVLELQKTLEDLTSRVDVIKEENLKLRAENCVLGQYIENLMQASSVFQPVGSGRSGSSGGSGGSSRPNGPNGPNGQREETIGAVIRSCARVKQQQEGRGSGSKTAMKPFNQEK